MVTYNLQLDQDNILRVSFGEPGQNDQMVKDATSRLDEMVKAGELAGGRVLRINGPASVPVAMVLAHGLGHLYQAIAVYDPKMSKYVIAIAHGDRYGIGDLID